MTRARLHRELRHGACGVLLGLPVTIACSLTLQLDDQIACSADSDCPYTGGQGTCEDGFCRSPGNSTTGNVEDSSSGTTPTSLSATTTLSTSDTTSSPETTDATTTDTTTGPAGCVLNSECEDDQRCGPDGACLDLLSAECQILVVPAGADVDNLVFVGSIMPTGAPFTNLVQPLENATLLAIEDFNQETTLQGDRQVGWVGCDDSLGGNAASDAATHLVTNVGVSAIIGPIFSESVLDVANGVTIPAGTFMMAPAATAMSIAGLDDDNLVWRTIAGDVYQANGIVDRLIDLDEGVDPDGAGPDTANAVTNLLILAKNDAYGNGLLNDVLPDLEDGLAAADIYAATYPDPTSFASQDELLAAYGEVLAGAAVDSAYPYTHVLFIGTSELQAMFYSYLGVVWNPAMDPLPLFTMSHGAVPELERFIEEIGPTPGTAPLVPLKPLIERRLQGTSPVVLNPDNFDAFSVRYRIRFNDEEPLTSSALSYDATLATLFSMCTVAADEPVTGAAIAAGMPRLVDADGTPVAFSGSDLSFIVEARNALATGDGSVDLQGVSGELQWDVTTGDIRADVWGWNVLDPSGDGSMPTAAPTRIYSLNDEPATDGVWFDIP